MRLVELSESIAAGRTTPASLLERCLARIEEREDAVQAWAYVAAREAREEAARLSRELEESGPRSPLHGIPIGVKDIFDVAGMPCEWGSPVERGRTPQADAALVQRFRELGAVVLGKTHTTAYAYFDPAPTRNPRNPEHTPGGSSSGSAAAVADGMVPLAIGSQTMGSVLRPASFCGIVGFKPTFGALPLAGAMPFAPSFDHAGLFTADVPDMVSVWRTLAGPKAPLSPRKTRLIALPWPIEGSLEAPMDETFRTALGKLRAAGWDVAEAPLPEGFAGLPAAIQTVMSGESAAIHGSRFSRHGEKIGQKLAQLIAKGLSVETSELEAAQQTIQTAQESLAALAGQDSVIATPSALGGAPEGLDSTGDPRCNAPWTALGAPAVSLPCGETAEGLPLGLQLSAGRGQESLLLAAALACESVLVSD